MNDCRTCHGTGAHPDCDGHGCYGCDPETGNCPTCCGTGNDPRHWTRRPTRPLHAPQAGAQPRNPTRDELNQIGSGMLLRRVRAAEAVAWQALNITPLKDETAEQLLARIRFSAEQNHPELLVRFEHSRQDIYRRAEDCGCDPNADDYDDNHSESDEGGEYLCGRQHLGMVCGTCENEADDGPSWRPDRYEWPCPPVRALDTPTA